MIQVMINDRACFLEKEDRGYLAGEIKFASVPNSIVNNVSMHVEAIEASIKRDRTVAVNSTYQSMIDNWLIRNDGCSPHLLTIGEKRYFINVEVFAK